MRLLYVGAAGELALTARHHSDVPPYAILSHTWGPAEDEILFADIQNGTYKRKASAVRKINFCLDQIRKDGLNYVWIDTCCINKNDLPELSESINSMFRWYRDAAICYVYLSDVPSRGADRPWEERFTESRWFTRGWTLQELIAPRTLHFHSSEGDYLGARVDLLARLSQATKLPEPVLRGCDLDDYSSTMRRDWVLQRQTTKPEDKWYCMLGILGVSMPTIYGEGEDNAYKRLLSAIKDENDRKLYSRPLPSAFQHNPPASYPSTNPTLERSTRISSASGPSNIHSMMNDEDFRAELIKSLGFEQMDARKTSLRRAHARTCAWFQQHPDYLTWRTATDVHVNHGFLWIKGKPGAGKSTLMKFTLNRAEREPTDNLILVSFFFNARGEDLEKTTIGMYRSLLYQIFTKAPRLCHYLDRYLPSRTRSNSVPTWTIDMMRDLFDEIIEDLDGHHLKCFIDALDECAEEEVREMVEHFEELGEKAAANGTKLSICFASRHYPTIFIRRGLKVTLEDQSGHKNDINNYIESRLESGGSKIVEEIKQRIQEKADGVFMWTKLVLDILEPEIRRGRLYAVQTSLEEIPDELSALFRNILRRDTANMDELLLCLQWILFAKRPLTRQEFYFAIVAGTARSHKRTPDMQWDPDKITTDTMDRFILNATKGLAALTRSIIPTVQFIHESVRDFLLKDGGLYELWPEVGQDPGPSSHDRLKECCAESLFHNSNFRTTISIQEYPDLDTIFPFPVYSSEFILHHSNEAQRSVSQVSFLKQFPIGVWKAIRITFMKYILEYHPSFLERHNIACITERTTLQYICVAEKHARLIHAFQSFGSTGIHSPPHGSSLYPIMVAFNNNDLETLTAILPDVNRDEWRKALDEEGVPIPWGPLEDYGLPLGGEPLGWALKSNYFLLARILWRSPHYSKSGVSLDSIIGLAVRRGHISLLEKIDNDHERLHSSRLGSSRTSLNRLLLSTPVDRGGDEYLGWLLQPEVYCAEAQPAYEPWCEGEGDDSIYFAALRGSYRIVQLLLKWEDHHRGPHRCTIGHVVEATNWKKHPDIFELLSNFYLGHDCADLKLGLSIYKALSSGSISLLTRFLELAMTMEIPDISLASQIRPYFDAQMIPESKMHQFIANLGYRSTEYSEALRHASSIGDLAAVELLLKFRSHPDFASQPLAEAISAASMSKHEGVTQLLLNVIEAQVISGGHCTSLGVAACFGLLEYAIQLLNKGANVHQASCRRLQPLSLACWSGHLPLVELLMSRGARLTHEDIPTQPPVTGLMWDHCLPLKALGYGPHATPFSTGMTVAAPLAIAAVRGHLDIVQALVAHGANVDEDFDKNENALYMSTLAGHYAICDYLLRRRAKLHVSIARNMGTELYIATINLDRQLVELFLAWGARDNINAIGGVHGTAIEAAFYICSMEDQLHKDRTIRDVVEVLLDNGAYLSFAKVQNVLGNLLENPNRSPMLFELLNDRFPEEIHRMMAAGD